MSADRTALLADYISARLSMPFKWGQNDCVCFAVGWQELATGRDILSAYRPWRTEREALRNIKRPGGLERLFDAHFTRIEPNYAKDGDLALVDGTAYLFSGSWVVSVGKDGLIFKTRTEAACAWSC